MMLNEAWEFKVFDYLYENIFGEINGFYLIAFLAQFWPHGLLLLPSELPSRRTYMLRLEILSPGKISTLVA